MGWVLNQISRQVPTEVAKMGYLLTFLKVKNMKIAKLLIFVPMKDAFVIRIMFI